MPCVFSKTVEPWQSDFWICERSGNCLAYSSGNCSFLEVVIFLVLSCTDCYSAKDSTEPLCKFLELFLLLVSSSPVHYPASTAFVLASLPSLNLNLCLLNSARLLSSIWIPVSLYCSLKIAEWL